jgi:hypothetical protein
MDELKNKIAAAVQKTGYPLEQRVSYLLQERDWTPFHSVVYTEPESGKERELDILAYKLINERRVELRISCKRSISKPWVLFTEDSRRYFKSGRILKSTPVVSDPSHQHKVANVLQSLRFFSHTRRAINFTAFSGKDLGDNARSIVKDGLYSALTSVYYRFFPFDLLWDLRGTIVFFVTLFDGPLFESYYDPIAGKDQLDQIEYGQWDTKFRLHSIVKEIKKSDGTLIDLSSVLYGF